MNILTIILSIVIILLICTISVLFIKISKLKNDKYNKLKDYEEELKFRENEILTKEKESLAKIEQEKIRAESDVKQEFINKQKEFDNKSLEKQHLLEEQFTAKQIEINNILVNKKTEALSQIKDIENEANQKIYEIKETLKNYQDLESKVIKEFIEKEKTEQQWKFYSICLNDEDKQDIMILKPVAKQISRPIILYKLLYEIYYKPKLELVFKRVLTDCPTKGGIYKITNIKNNKVYIGQTKDFLSRWRQHAKEGVNYTTSKIANNRLYIAMQEDGLENFAFEVIDSCDDSLLNEREKYWINFYHSTEYGYNSKIG